MDSVSELPASATQRRLAFAFVVLSAAVFAAAAPFARVQLAPVQGFIPVYETALVACDLLTAAMLLGQYRFFRSRAMLILGCGYCFTALIAIAHMLTFPGLFAPGGVLGGGPQTTAWLYMFWHAGFPPFVIAYALLKARPSDAEHELARVTGWGLAGVALLAALFVMLATAGHAALPAIMAGNRYTPSMLAVVTGTWVMSLVAFGVLFRRGPHTVIDVWLMAVSWAWVFDIALSAVLNAGRFDLGFYAGRIYGLVAASLLLIVLVVENARLYARLRARTLEMEHAREAAQEAERKERAFLATMSHEIRTPMNGVMGMLELLSLTRLDGEQRTTLEIVRESSRSLLRIIDDILDFSKIEAGKLDLRPEAASIARVIERVCNVYSGNASSKGLALTSLVDPAIGPYVMVDPLRLQQILNNLVSNAIRFTQKGEVSIRAELLEAVAGTQRIRFTVADTGVGIAAQDLAKLFKPFTQASSQGSGGTGLGLSICNRLASLMGGTIELASEPGAGTKAILTLTLPQAEAPPVAVTAPLAAPSRPATSPETPAVRLAPPSIEAARGAEMLVLLVDDNAVSRLVAQKQLQQLGYASVAVDNGVCALRELERGGVGAIITDCHMPRMDGYELARQVREREASKRLPRVPIIAATASALPGEAEKCFGAGMDDYLLKPINLERLRGKLRFWLPLPDPASPIDPGVLQSVSHGDRVLAARMLERYWNRIVEDIAALRAAVDAGRLDDIVDCADRIKNVGVCIGANAVAAVCERILLAAGGGDLRGISEGMTALAREWERLERHMAAAGA